MASGGARNRSGPQADPRSARSDARGLQFLRLPAEGYAGEVPPFPLPPRRVMRWVVEGKARWQELDIEATATVADRESALWDWAWRTPQAVAWSRPSEMWRLYAIAMWVRTYVLCESSEATAADRGSLHRFADQIGLTPAGLRENGWAVSTDELADRRDHVAAPTSEAGSADELADRRRALSGSA